MKTRIKNTLVLLITGLLFINISYSQDGIIDTSFGNSGTKILSVSGKSTRGKSIILLDDNSMLVGVNSEFSQFGNTSNRGFYVYKLLPNGNIDINFGLNGYLFFSNQGNSRSLIGSLTKLNNDEILIHCLLLDENKIIKIDSNGEIIMTFVIPSNFNIYYKNIGIQSNSKIVVSGQYYDGYNNKYSLSRFNSDGTIDTSFGNNGIVIADITSYRFDIGASLRIQDDDKIIIVGKSYNVGNDLHAVITRFNENGIIDTSFGNNGTTITPLIENSDFGEYNDVKLYFDGTIIVGGNAYYEGGTAGFFGVKPTVVKYTSNGFLDNSFGEQGIVNFETIYGANEYLRTINIQSDGKIVIGGGASYPYPYYQTNFYLSRLNENGTLDIDFGNNGIFLTNFENSETNYSTSIVFQNDKIIALGCSKTANNEFRTAIVCRLTNESLSVSDYIKNSTIFFPNPTYNEIFIQSNHKFNKIIIYDLQGKLIKNNSFDLRTELEYDLTNLNYGTYYIVVMFNNKIVSKKTIIKE